MTPLERWFGSILGATQRNMGSCMYLLCQLGICIYHVRWDNSGVTQHSM